MPDAFVLARMLTVLDLKFEKAMHYHDEGFESNNNCGLPTQVKRPVPHLFGFTTETSYNPAECMVTQCPISPFTLRRSRRLPFCEGVH